MVHALEIVSVLALHEPLRVRLPFPSRGGLMSDPDEAKRGNEMSSQNDEMIELNNKMVELNNKMLFFSRVSTFTAVFALLVSLFALALTYHWHH